MKNEQRRRMRYARLRAQKKAVSPVVATLILILVAVAAAAALYLWLVAWQGGITKGIGTPSAQYTVTIGGSTSVYPFAEQAATWFEDNNSDVVISVNQGGSGAGAAAVCSGQIDIGEMSSYSYTASDLETAYGCPQSLNQQIVAYDGVDVIVAANNPHFVTAADAALSGVSGALPNSMSWDTMNAIYDDVSSTTGTGTNLLQPGSFTMDGVASAQPTQGTGFVWDQIPAFAGALLGTTPTGIGVAFTATGYTLTAGGALGAAEAACATTGYTHDLCDATAQADSCGFSICLGGTGNVATTGGDQAPIDVNYRSEVSGTTQGFTARIMAVGASGGTPLGVGFTGCGSDGQLSSCLLTYGGSTHTTGGTGNPAVITDVAGQVDGIGYASDGLVQVSTVVVPVNLEGYGQTVVVNMQGASTALAAIALGIEDVNAGSSSYATGQAYIGWRPFINTETATPTGEVLRYLEFVMDPANNQAIATATAEISVYASGLAGHVPITPLTGYQIPASF